MTTICKYYNKCGGCSLQHIPYELQLENKKKQLQAIIKQEDIEVISDNPFQYRNRMDVVFGKNKIGFRKKRSFDIIDIEECPISNSKLNILLNEIRKEFKIQDNYSFKQGRGTYKYAVIRTPSKSSSISFVLNPESTRLSVAIEKIKDFAKHTTSDNIIITYTNKDDSISSDYFVVKGKDTLQESIKEKEFNFSVQGFFQNNTGIANKLHDYVSNILQKHNTKDKELLDLYGGVGTFGIINSSLFKNVTIVEDFQGSIDSANENISNNNITNAKTICMDAKKIKRLEYAKNQFIITDPPRAGMHNETIAEIKKLQPECLIYISCNPHQLKKELTKLTSFKVLSAAVFDMFPQTNHFEVVLELKFETYNNE